MNAEIVAIGTELLLGQIIDSNAALLGRRLAEHGVPVYQKTTVGDNLGRIVRTLDAALDRADAVITSGGLGPTEDDLTREAIAAVLGRPMEDRPELLEQLEALFRRIGRPMTENNKKQARLPQGAEAIPNPNGTAPGVLAESPRGVVIALPGVPHELEAMLEASVVPYLAERFSLNTVLRSRILLVCGMGESRVDEAIGALIRDSANPTVGVLASPGIVRIRITASAETEAAALEAIAPVEADIRRRLPGLIMGTDDDTLESVVGALLAARGWRMAVAETSTGGALCRQLAAAPGETFAGGLVMPPAAYAGCPPPDPDDLAQAARKPSQAECAVALVYDPAAESTRGVFISPEGRTEWTFTWPDFDRFGQVRGAAMVLETVRRQLAADAE